MLLGLFASLSFRLFYKEIVSSLFFHALGFLLLLSEYFYVLQKTSNDEQKEIWKRKRERKLQNVYMKLNTETKTFLNSLISLLHVMLYHFRDCLFKNFFFLKQWCFFSMENVYNVHIDLNTQQILVEVLWSSILLPLLAFLLVLRIFFIVIPNILFFYLFLFLLLVLCFRFSQCPLQFEVLSLAFYTWTG